jgi:hypothetical protein
MKPETKVIAQRWARQMCVKRMCRKLRKYGAAIVMTHVVDLDTERAAVDEIIREEKR